MKVTIDATPEEVAALVVGLQERTIPVDAVAEEMTKRLSEAASTAASFSRRAGHTCVPPTTIKPPMPRKMGGR